MTALPIHSAFNRARWMQLADWLAVGVAVSLPWSTSATGILIAVWLITVLPTLNVGFGPARACDRRRRLAGPALGAGGSRDVVGRRDLG